MKFFILFFMSLCCLSTHAQYPGIKDDPETGYIIVDLSEDNPLAYYTKSDTTHYYVVFESFFQDNNVRVYCNDSLIFRDKITSDESVGLAKKVKVGSVDSVKKISIGIEDSPLILVYPMKGKYYLRVKCSSYPFWLLRFSKFDIIRK